MRTNAKIAIASLKPIVTLLTLAGLAAGAAAQSVTIFGLVDLSVQHLRSGNQSVLAGGHMTRLADGVIYGPGSRWGIRVSEDLGGGLTARVLLESGFAADTGTLTQGGRGFGRQSYLALSSTSAGELRLGRQYTLHDETMANLNPARNITPLNPGGIYTLPTGTLPLFIDAPRIDNAIHYLSPLFGGFRVQGMVALGEGVMDRYQGLKTTYTGGPLTLGLSYEQSKAKTPVAGNATVDKILEFGGNYDFGIAALFAGYQQGKDLTTGPASQPQIGTLTLPGLTGKATDAKAYNIGVSVPVGGLTELLANYTRSKFGNSAGEVSLGRVGVGANYLLSKRTTVYGTITLATGDLKTSVNEKQLYQLGLRTTF